MRLLPVILTVFAASAAAMEAGFDVESFEDTDRNRPISIDWWYPVVDEAAGPFDYGLGRGRVVAEGPIAPGRFPLLLLSHGAMGAARNYSWLAEHLARQGFIVAGVSHFGESYVFGSDTIDPTEVLRHWKRPVDISAALTHIGNNSRYSRAIDTDRVGFVGHSSGGATAMYLAGARFDQSAMGAYCRSPDALRDRGCDYARATAVEPAGVNPEPLTPGYADRRIRAFVALDPALGPGFTDFTNVNPTLRFQIVGSVDNDFLPFGPHALHYADHLPGAVLHRLERGEGHFVYLNECDADITANGVPLCKDRPGVARKAVHQALCTLIAAFFRDALADNRATERS